MSNLIENNYKGYEIFMDMSYFDMIAVRPIGERRFEYTFHVDSVEEAKKWVDNQIKENG